MRICWGWSEFRVFKFLVFVFLNLQKFMTTYTFFVQMSNLVKSHLLKACQVFSLFIRVKMSKIDNLATT